MSLYYGTPKLGLKWTETVIPEDGQLKCQFTRTSQLMVGWGQRGSNPRQTDYESAALTD